MFYAGTRRDVVEARYVLALPIHSGLVEQRLIVIYDQCNTSMLHCGCTNVIYTITITWTGDCMQWSCSARYYMRCKSSVLYIVVVD